jgi:hypothetical protein
MLCRRAVSQGIAYAHEIQHPKVLIKQANCRGQHRNPGEVSRYQD